MIQHRNRFRRIFGRMVPPTVIRPTPTSVWIAPEPDRRRLAVYWDSRDWWVGVYRAEDHVYVCPLPCLVIRWARVRYLASGGCAPGGVLGPQWREVGYTGVQGAFGTAINPEQARPYGRAALDRINLLPAKPRRIVPRTPYYEAPVDPDHRAAVHAWDGDLGLDGTVCGRRGPRKPLLMDSPLINCRDCRDLIAAKVARRG